MAKKTAKKPKPPAKRAVKLTTAKIRTLVEKHVRRPFSAEQSKDISFHYYEGERVRGVLSDLKARRKELRDQIGAEQAERAASIAHENEQGRGAPVDPNNPGKVTTPYSLDASRKISGHEIEIKRYTIQLGDVEKEIRDTTASSREQSRALCRVIDEAWEGPSLFDKPEPASAAPAAGEPKTDGAGDDESNEE